MVRAKKQGLDKNAKVRQFVSFFTKLISYRVREFSWHSKLKSWSLFNNNIHVKFYSPPVPVHAERQIEWMTGQWVQHCYSHKQRLMGFPSMFVGHTLTAECTGCSSVKKKKQRKKFHLVNQFNEITQWLLYKNYPTKGNRQCTALTLLNTQISPLAVALGTPCPL